MWRSCIRHPHPFARFQFTAHTQHLVSYFWYTLQLHTQDWHNYYSTLSRFRVDENVSRSCARFEHIFSNNKYIVLEKQTFCVDKIKF